MARTQLKKTVLTLQDVCFSYDRKAKDSDVLKDISLSIKEGEFLCLLGPSGCGKSTLLKIMADLQKANSGTLRFLNDSARKAKVGMVFQDLALFPHMSVARNVGFALRDMPRQKRRARTDDMLELVGLLDKRGAYPHQLSGGQKQRLAIARALAPAPDLILLDEPFVSQDLVLRNRLRDDVMHILRESGVAALLVTHDPEEAMQFGDRIAIMKDGEIEQTGTPHEVYNNPVNAFVASFFGHVDVLHATVEGGALQTALGPIDAQEYADGVKMKVIIRPEAFKLSAHDPSIDHNDPAHFHVHGHIVEHKYVGRSTLLHLDTCDDDPLHIHARIPGAYTPPQAQMQDVFLDQTQIFMFEEGA